MAGTYRLPTGEVINLVEWVEDAVYDKVQLDASISAGAEYVFFRDIQNKDLNETNMRVSSRLEPGWEMIVWRIGFVVAAQTAFDNLLKILDNAYAEFNLGTKTVKQGPIWLFQTGFGISGAVTIDAASSETVKHTANIGPSGTNLVAPLSIPIHITDDVSFQAVIRFFDATTLTAATDVWGVLYGWVKRPVR